MRPQWSASNVTHLLMNIWNEASRLKTPFLVADNARSGEWYASTMLSKCVRFDGRLALWVVELPAAGVCLAWELGVLIKDPNGTSSPGRRHRVGYIYRTCCSPTTQALAGRSETLKTRR